MHLCLHSYGFLPAYVSTYIYAACTHTYIYAFIPNYIDKYVYTYISMHVYLHKYGCQYIQNMFAYMHTQKHIYIRLMEWNVIILAYQNDIRM